MKPIVRVVMICLVAFFAISTALARKPSAPPALTVPGVYENFTVGKGSGDLEGMRVVIVPAGGGYYAIVQIAQGGAEDPKPEFVEARVKGKTVSFTVGGEKYTGAVSVSTLTIKDSAGVSTILKRKACSSLFK